MNDDERRIIIREYVKDEEETLNTIYIVSYRIR